MTIFLEASAPAGYHLLYKEPLHASGSSKETACAVSVDRCLEESELKALICEIISQEKLLNCSALAITVLLGVDSYNPKAEHDVFLPPMETPKDLIQRLDKRALGVYFWTKKPGGKTQSTLIVVNDRNCDGPAQDRRVTFGHTVGCRGTPAK